LAARWAVRGWDEVAATDLERAAALDPIGDGKRNQEENDAAGQGDS
jgi:hypothetical protein